MKNSLKYLVLIIVLGLISLHNQVSAQCSTVSQSLWENTWESCEMTQSPNSERGEGHWIMYDLGSVYTISSSRIWNSNVDLAKGVKSLIVDYSLDGVTWTQLDTLEIAKGEGINEYSGVPGPNFNDSKVRYILLHIESNWGHEQCAGFAEIRIILNEQFTRIINEVDEEDDTENEDGEDESEDGEEECDEEGEEDESDDMGEEDDLDECSAPNNVTALVINPYEVWILWEGESSGSFLVSIRTADMEWIEIETEDQEVFIEDLESGVEYELFVQTICNDEVLSSEIERFYVPKEIEECITPSYSDVFISQDGFVIIVWNEVDEAEGYELRFRPEDSDVDWESVRTNENIVEFEDIDVEVGFEYQVRVNCNGDWSEWSDVFNNISDDKETEDLTTNINESAEHRFIAINIKVKVFPNPTSQTIQFSVENDAKTTLHIQLSDFSGKPYQLLSRSALKGVNTYNLEIQNLSSGVYFLSVKDMVSQLTTTSRVMVMNE